jgi:uncharacterized protein (DUF58 family)
MPEPPTNREHKATPVPPPLKRASQSRIRAWLQARVRERVTLIGALYLVALLLTGLAAFASANNLLFLILSAMLATFMISGLINRLGIAGLELDVRLPEHISARRTTPARLLLRNAKRRIPSFSVQVVGVEDSVFTTAVYFPVIPGGAELETTLDVVFERRGSHAGDSFQFSSRFPFGFAERRIRVLMNREVVVYPCLDPQPGFDQLLAGIAGEAESSLQGRGHDFYRIRPYEPFESARHVDWRATAHTGSLQVREFARDQDPLIAIFLDLEASFDHWQWFECAVEACAYLAWQMTARGARIHFRTQDWEILTPLEDDVYAILRYLALVSARGRAIPLQNDLEPAVAIVFTAQPGRLDELAWSSARILHPGCFPAPGARPDPARRHS